MPTDWNSTCIFLFEFYLSRYYRLFLFSCMGLPFFELCGSQWCLQVEGEHVLGFDPIRLIVEWIELDRVWFYLNQC